MDYEVCVSSIDADEYGFPKTFLQEIWFAAAVTGQPRHRENGPCHVISKPDTFERVYEEWQDMGVTHRVGGPATIHKLNGIRTETWQFRGERHCLHGPAHTVTRVEDGCRLEEEWFEHGKRHRMDGPAIIQRDAETGNIAYEAWYRFGELSRRDGPAEIFYNSRSGEVSKTSFYRDGKKHKPAANPHPAP